MVDFASDLSLQSSITPLSFAAWIESTKIGLDALEAGSALSAWMPERDVTTFSGSDISAIVDPWSNANMAHLATLPPWLESGGPGSRPAIDLGSQSSRGLLATVGTYASGNRVSAYCVTAATGTGGGSAAYLSPAAGGDTLAFYSDTSAFKLFVDFDVGASFNAALTVPAFDNAWHVIALRPLATGSLSQFDGADTTANPAGDGLAEAGKAYIGSPYALNNGNLVAGLFLINNATAAKDTFFRAQLAVWFGAIP